MSEPEKFLGRWSRRKREQAEPAAPAEAKPAPPPEAAEPAEPPFDLASLPPLESIGAASDIRAFLQPGVPPDLMRAALRRAWSADPAIRDFIGLVENGWDFNNPNAIPGFGTIEPGEIARLLTQALGAAQPSEPAPPQANAPEPSALVLPEGGQASQVQQDQPRPEQVFAPAAKDFVQRSEDIAASQNDSHTNENCAPSRSRGHGGALPK
jgi:hypothetical protein